MISSTACAAVLAAGLAAAGAAPQDAQAPSADASQRPAFRTDANFVRVDVYPTLGGKPLVDLGREDFELLEDGRPQAIETFEYIRISAGSQASRPDPNTVDAMRQAATDPRSRVFVIFLDAPHVTASAARNVGSALVRFLDRALGPDDLVGVMTPGMSPADVVLARKRAVLDGGLSEGSWGRRFTRDEDQRESMYQACYRVLQQEREQGKTTSDLAKVLTVRRREALTLDALRDLVVYLRGLREERKAILAVTEGWALYRPDSEIMRLREECTCPAGQPRRDLQDCGGCKPWPPNSPWKETPPGAEPIRVGPDGKFRIGSIETLSGTVDATQCAADRMRLASIDHQRVALDLANDANRANATFYAIDPRGLAVFDTPIYRDGDEVGTPPNVVADQQGLRSRQAAMADLATATDGIAVINTNDLDAGLQRIADDLGAYYLLGYYSSNPKLDGKFRAITVRVKRPGVNVRARRGYRAPTEAEVAAARPAPAIPAHAVSPVAAALATLARLQSGDRFRMHAVPVRATTAGAPETLWVAGELPVSLRDWAQGGTVTLDVTGTAISAAASVTLKPGERAFVTSLPISGAGTVADVRGRLTSADPSVTPFTESVRVDLTPGAAPQPLLFRRGPVTGNRWHPAASFQFSRSERARLDFAVPQGVKPAYARLLDRAGHELNIPVNLAARHDPAGGQQWLTAELVLAPLAAGDYVVAIGFGGGDVQQKILTAIKVTR